VRGGRRPGTSTAPATPSSRPGRPGSTPIEQFLAGAPAPIHHELLCELLELEVAYRKRSGERPTLGEYLKRLPDYFTATRRAESLLGDLHSLAFLPPAGTAPATAPTEPTAPLPSSPPGWPTVPGYEIAEELGRGGTVVAGQVDEAEAALAEQFLDAIAADVRRQRGGVGQCGGDGLPFTRRRGPQRLGVFAHGASGAETIVASAPADDSRPADTLQRVA
jgi:hypothetical protein